ncbi:MAG: AarF/UbiB family protein [Verrucomicrobiota bacterium]
MSSLVENLPTSLHSPPAKEQGTSFLKVAGRYQEILQVLIQYGFRDLLNLMKIEGVLKLTPKLFSEKTHQMAQKPLALRIRLALEELGPTFVKAGQILSSRRDLIDDDLYRELCRLHQNVAPVSWEEIHAQIEEQLGAPIEEVFSNIEIIPLASASIAQVHRATLRLGQIPVVIKVRRPGIRQVIQSDIDVMRHFARLLEKHVPSSRLYTPRALVEEFGRGLLRELDFEWEADQQKEFGRTFLNFENVIVPYVYEEFSSEGLLVLECVEGIRPDQPELLLRQGLLLPPIAEEMARLAFRMILIDGFFHADPHPGNMAIAKDGKIILYDFGWMGRYSENFREQLALGMHGLAHHDGGRLTEALLGMSLTGHVDELGVLQEDLALFSSEYLDGPLEEISLEEALNRLLEILRIHNLRMRPEFYLGIKALTQVELLARLLHPRINYVQLAEPYARAVIEKKFSIPELGKSLYWGGVELASLLKDLPLEMRNFFNRFKKGDMQIPICHKVDPEGFEPLRSTMNHIANRMATALISASFLITSGLLLHVNSTSNYINFHLLGIVCLGIGTFLAIRLHWSIWRRGGM